MFRIIIYIISFLTLVFLYFISPDTIEKQFSTLVVLIVSIQLFIFFNTQYFKKNILIHSTIFLIGYFIVHFQYLIINLLGYEVVTNIDVWVDERIVSKSLVLSGLGVTSFLIGHSLKQILSNRKKKGNSILKMKIKPSSLFAWMSWILFAGFLYTANPAYLSGNYGAEALGQTATYLQLLLTIVFNAIFIIEALVLVKSRYKVSFYNYIMSLSRPLKLIVIVYLVTMLFIGDRGPVISLLLLLSGTYVFYYSKWIKSVYFLLLVFIGAFFMTTIGVFRSTDKNLSIGERLEVTISKNQENSTPFNNSNELASSVRTLHYAVSAVPNNYNYTYGRFQAQQILTSIPGVGYILTKFIDNRFQYKGSASFITYLDQGPNPRYGLGTTCIADLYIDFGFLGVIIGMFVFGKFMYNVEQVFISSQFSSLLSLVIAMVYFSKTVYIGRSTLLVGIKEVLWTYVIISIYFYIIKRIKG